MKSKLHIFGGGFVSYNVIKNLKDKYNIILYSRKPFEEFSGIKHIQVDNLASYKEVREKNESIFNDSVLITASTGGSRFKKDSWKDYINNIESFMNIYATSLNCQSIFYIGSGAGEEVYTNFRSDFYALSKRIIGNFINRDCMDNLCEMVVYGSFGEKELDTRFIKSCFENCRRGLPLYIDKNIKFDYISMYDFSTILDYQISKGYIDNKIYCTYEEKRTLEQIARFINNLYNNKSIIIVRQEPDYTIDSDYTSPYSDYDEYSSICLGFEESLIKMKTEYYDKLPEIKNERGS